MRLLLTVRTLPRAMFALILALVLVPHVGADERLGGI
jgi:hypothetical protein